MGFQKHDGIVQQSSAAKYFRPMKKIIIHYPCFLGMQEVTGNCYIAG